MAPPAAFVKLPQIVLGFICLGIVVYHVSVKVPKESGIPTTAIVTGSSEIFYFNLVTFFCIMSSGVLFLSFLVQPEHHKKAFAELIFSLVSTILIATASLSLLIYLVRYKSFAKKMGVTTIDGYGVTIAAGVLGLLNSVFYAVSTLLAFKDFRS